MGKVSNDYAKYRDHLPEILFDQMKDRGIDFRGMNVVDLGSGSGIFSRDLAKQGANVIGIEPSSELIEEALRLDRISGFHSNKYVHAKAEEFLLQDTYPIFTAVRSWHWFDRSDVIQNIKKHLKPNGNLIIINSIFLPTSEVAKLTFSVLANNNIEIKPAGSNAEVKERRSGFPVNWFDEWEKNSFKVTDEWQYEYFLEFTHDEWCGKIRSVSWMTNTTEELKTKVTNELLSKLVESEEVLNIPHKFSVVILKHF